MITQKEWQTQLADLFGYLLVLLSQERVVPLDKLQDLIQRFEKLRKQEVSQSRGWDDFRANQFFKIQPYEGGEYYLQGYSELARWTGWTEQSCKVKISKGNGVISFGEGDGHIDFIKCKIEFSSEIKKGLESGELKSGFTLAPTLKMYNSRYFQRYK